MTISGSAFTGVMSVSFGGFSAASYTVVNSNTITATAPAGSAGTVDVTVATMAGTSATSAIDHYTYTSGTGGAPAVSLSSSDFAAQAGESLTFDASVSNAGPGGSVTFYLNGSTALATVPVTQGMMGPEARYTCTLPAGSFQITAVFTSADPAVGSVTSAVLTQAVQPDWLTLMPWSSSPSAAAGQAVTITAALGGITGPVRPTGTMTFLVDGVLAATVAMDGTAGPDPAFTTSSLTPGSHTITAVYSGDPDFNATSAWLTEIISS